MPSVDRQGKEPKPLTPYAVAENNMEAVYIPDLNTTTALIEIPASEVTHLRALRIRHNDGFLALNGRGLVAGCRLSVVGSKTFATIVNLRTEPAPPGEKVIACIPLLSSKDRFDFAVEKCTELGADGIIPYTSRYTQIPTTNIDRIVAKSIAASKQCMRAYFPSVRPVQTFEQIINTISSLGAHLVYGDASGSLEFMPRAGATFCLCGPEGGLSPEELTLVHALSTSQAIALGKFRLRAETAIVTLVGLVGRGG